MKGIRHYVFALISIFLLGWIAGPQPAIWAAVAFCAYLVVKSLGDSFLGRVNFLPNAEHENVWNYRIGATLVWGSVGIVILATILLFQRFGWVSAVGLVILTFGYGGLRETKPKK